MKQRILTAVVIVPLFITLSTTPAYGLFGAILAGIQRAQMIINQGVQIYKDTMAKITFDGQLTEMVNQAEHLKEQALGAVGQLTDPFTEMASVPTTFIGVGLSWKNDFTGVAGELASSVEQMGENRQELPRIVVTAAHRRRHGDGERHSLSVRRLSPGDRSEGGKPIPRGAGEKR